MGAKKAKKKKKKASKKVKKKAAKAKAANKAKKKAKKVKKVPKKRLATEKKLRHEEDYFAKKAGIKPVNVVNKDGHLKKSTAAKNTKAVKKAKEIELDAGLRTSPIL